VDFGANDKAEVAGFDRMTTFVGVDRNDGTVVKARADFGKGSPSSFMCDDEISANTQFLAARGRAPFSAKIFVLSIARD
jgi:hypothetical protein